MSLFLLILSFLFLFAPKGQPWGIQEILKLVWAWLHGLGQRSTACAASFLPAESPFLEPEQWDFNEIFNEIFNESNDFFL